MDSDLNQALRSFEATEANLVKLERLWKEMEGFLASANGSADSDDNARYEDHRRSFLRILKAMPKIDGHELADMTQSYRDVFRNYIDSNDVGDIDALLSHGEFATRQRDLIAEYRHRLDAKWRELASQTIASHCASVESCLRKLTADTEGMASQMPVHDRPEWEQLRKAIASIATLMGSSWKPPKEWSTLHRHLRFGLKSDLDDIAKADWPSVRSCFEQGLYGENDPVPVQVEDMGELVKSRPSGPVVTELKWDQLTAEDFERLIFNLISTTKGYERPEWLMHTNAPDRGRDLSVYCVRQDELTGPRSSRVIIACKHWLSRSVGTNEITGLRDQVALWEPPRVDELILATSGHFSADAVQLVEKHNQSDKALRIEMWPSTHLEMLLTRRPELIAVFKLR